MSSETAGAYREVCHRLKKVFQEYCSNSSIHGIRYVGCERRSVFEKIWWLVTILVSVYGCAHLIQKVYHKWDQTPVIVTFNDKSTPVWQIPFPAVTICPESKFSGDSYNFTKTALNLMKHNTESDEISYDRFRALLQVCNPNFLEELSVDLNQTYDNKCVDLLRNVAISPLYMFYECVWRNEGTPCYQIFSETLTEKGFCYTFNSLAARDLLRQEELHEDYAYLEESRSSPDWTMEDGYREDADIDTYPMRVLGPGSNAGLSVTFNSLNFNFDLLCQGTLTGFRVTLHSSSEYPQVVNKFFPLPEQQDVLISVKPQIITTSDGLRDYDPHRRRCYFNHERRLKFFKIYTQQNCQLECLTNYTRKVCGCVRFSMPRDNQTAICGASKIRCYEKAETALLGQEVRHRANKIFESRKTCDCLPACTSVQYDVEVFQNDFRMKEFYSAFSSNTERHISSYTRLTIYFKNAQFITSKRSELYGMTDFLANCGGLLGLFMGVSLLSLAEIIYFCSIRLCLVLRTSARTEKSADGVHPKVRSKSDKIKLGKCLNVRKQLNCCCCRKKNRKNAHSMRVSTNTQQK